MSDTDDDTEITPPTGADADAAAEVLAALDGTTLAEAGGEGEGSGDSDGEGDGEPHAAADAEPEADS